MRWGMADLQQGLDGQLGREAEVLTACRSG